MQTEKEAIVDTDFHDSDNNKPFIGIGFEMSRQNLPVSNQ